MIRKILLVMSVCVFFAAGIYAQGDSASTKTDKSASASDTSDKAPAFRPTKDQIKKGQEILIAQKLWTGEATGVYGECRPAIKAYQKANGLEQTGKFDKPTLAKMNIPLTDKQKGTDSSSGSTSSSKATSTSSSSKTSTDDGPKRPAPFRANADQIKAAQRLLKDGKMYSGEETGKFDDAFRDGLGKYQEAKGLKVTKTLNAATLEKMGIGLTDAQKANVAAQKAYDAGKKD